MSDEKRIVIELSEKEVRTICGGLLYMMVHNKEMMDIIESDDETSPFDDPEMVKKISYNNLLGQAADADAVRDKISEAMWGGQQR